ncbi:MAG: hypothetical protein M1839_000467 [Geoglossum umbratile]|nr:MAG: hypothetical protein M1839_000467 [Geoglossum umbratile]
MNRLDWIDEEDEMDEMRDIEPRDDRDQMDIIQGFYYKTDEFLERPIVPLYFAPTHLIPFPLPTQQDIDKSTDVICGTGYEQKVVRVSERFAVKYGKYVDPMEGTNMIFVKDNNTGIPVPRVYAIYSEGDITYIVMEYIEGKTLEAEWDTLSKVQRNAILAKLRGYMNRLRAIRCYSKTYFGSLYGAPLPSARHLQPKEVGHMLGPFSNEQDFNNDAILKRLVYDLATANSVGYFGENLGYMEPHETRFTHDAFRRRNIRVRRVPKTRNGQSDEDDFEITIMGWSRAGWYPSYWEYCSAMNYADIEETDWASVLDKIFEPYPEELRVMQMIRSELMGRKGLPL